MLAEGEVAALAGVGVLGPDFRGLSFGPSQPFAAGSASTVNRSRAFGALRQLLLGCGRRALFDRGHEDVENR